MSDIDKVDERLKGVFPPITTPFVGGEVAYDRLEENLDRWNATAIKSYVVLGSNGEFPYLTTEEKLKVIETVVKSAKPAGKVVIAGVSCESTKETVTLAKAAAGLGADFAIAVTPNYYKSKMTHGALAAYYTGVADASPIPVLIYNMPAYTGITVQPRTIAEVSKHPNIAGMKDSAGVMALTGGYIKESAPDFGVLAGSASFAYPGLVMGCCGGVMALACCCPQECCELYQLAVEGKHDEAREMQLRLIAPNTAVTSGYGIAGLKHAMELRGFFGGEVRSPLQPLTNDDKKAIEDTLQAAGLI
jgi:4-hydroxy-2-oxoglutarate aldolase